MASPNSLSSSGVTLGQFLMVEDINQAGIIAYNLRHLDHHDVIMVRKILEENWEDEEQMVSNLLQYPHLIPEDIRIQSLKRGLHDVESPYYILSSSVGLQRIQLCDGDWEQVVEGLKKACLHETGVVSMRAFMTLQPKLEYPRDLEFIIDILRQPKSALFQNTLIWLTIKANEKSEILKIIDTAGVVGKAKNKAEKIIEEQLKSKGSDGGQNLSLQFLNYIPNLNDFESMLDKQEALSDFFVDLDQDKDGKVSLKDVQNFLEDIGKKISIEEIKKDLNSVDIDLCDSLDKDTFIEFMFPRFQMR
eukprot:gene13840-4778_t